MPSADIDACLQLSRTHLRQSNIKVAKVSETNYLNWVSINSSEAFNEPSRRIADQTRP